MTMNFLRLPSESKATHEKILNLERISHIEVFASGGSSVYFEVDHCVRLGADETKALWTALATRMIESSG